MESKEGDDQVRMMERGYPVRLDITGTTGADVMAVELKMRKCMREAITYNSFRKTGKGFYVLKIGELRGYRKALIPDNWEPKSGVNIYPSLCPEIDQIHNVVIFGVDPSVDAGTIEE